LQFYYDSAGESALKSIVFLTFRFCWSLFKTRKSLVLENLMLRQQLNIYKRKNKRPKLENIDRIILVWISRVMPVPKVLVREKHHNSL
jgi:hypothetical protein